MRIDVLEAWLAEQAIPMTGRSIDEVRALLTRGNPYHGKDGKFSSGHGGGATPAEQFNDSIDAATGGREALDAPPADVRFTYEGRSKDAIELSRDEKTALNEYSSNAQEINGQLRTGKLSKANKKTVGDIDSVMERSTLDKDIVVHRGFMEHGKLFGDTSKDLTGTTLHDKGFMSTAADHRVAENFAGTFASSHTEAPIVARVLVPKGTGAITMSPWGSGSALHGGQSEILLQRGLTMTVVADHGVIPHPLVPSGLRTIDVIVH